MWRVLGAKDGLDLVAFGSGDFRKTFGRQFAIDNAEAVRVEAQLRLTMENGKSLHMKSGVSGAPESGLEKAFPGKRIDYLGNLRLAA